MGDLTIPIWLPVPPEVFGIVLGILAIFVAIWLYKLAASLIVGG